MEAVDKYAKIVWEYMLMHHELDSADLILVCGNDDEMTCECTVETFKKGLASIVLVSGSGSPKNREGFHEKEAEKIVSYLYTHEIGEESILIENQARSTGDNANFSRKLLEDKGMLPKKIILITKPYMERRAYATFKKQWPGPDFQVTSKKVSYEDYCKKFPDKEHFINLMVGDLQRIKEYPKQGFQIEQEIPEEVWKASQKLIELGYNKYLIK